MPALIRLLACWCLLGLAGPLHGAQPFRFPTANQSILEKDGEEKFFVGTVGRPWTSGAFGCVRTGGWQMHEGLDIRSIQRDKRGESTDPILATAAGTVAYISTRAGLSNYGIYVVLRHQIEGLEVCSLYAHLSEVRPGLQVGQSVKAGETIGTMGRTSNTRQAISRERAHLHFELNLFVSERFPDWYARTFPGQRNDHGMWNGQNLLGLDPQAILEQQARNPGEFSFLHFVRNQPELCRVLVRDTSFPWLKRYRLLIRRNPVAEREGVAAYEIALNANGVPFQLIPRAASEVKTKSRFQLLSVNEQEYRKNPCRKLVVQRGSSWALDTAGERLLGLLTH
jgi:peptidoglycan LD-endopeptidase LytH